MSQAKKVVNKTTAKVVAAMMGPMIALGLLVMSVAVYLVNNVYTGI